MSQKAENLLNLALDATEAEREKSLELDVGYNPIDREWDLIIKYSGTLEMVRALAVSVTELANQYAVIKIQESKIDTLTRLSEVDFIEKPKRLFFQVMNGKRVSCIDEVQKTPFCIGDEPSRACPRPWRCLSRMCLLALPVFCLAKNSTQRAG